MKFQIQISHTKRQKMSSKTLNRSKQIKKIPLVPKIINSKINTI